MEPSSRRRAPISRDRPRLRSVAAAPTPPVRVFIEGIRPSTPAGYPAKAVAQRNTEISADILCDGHELLVAWARWRRTGGASLHSVPLEHLANDRWEGHLVPDRVGLHEFYIEAGVDLYATWRQEILAKHSAGDDVSVELKEGVALLQRAATGGPNVGHRRLLLAAARDMGDAELTTAKRVRAGTGVQIRGAMMRSPLVAHITRSDQMSLWVDRERAAFGAWYEMFPRSEGGFAGTMRRLPAIARMGFDVVYLAPIHPIGTTKRKGPNNSEEGGTESVGSPWAIGAQGGGHMSIDPNLGTLTEFRALLSRARDLDLEVAMDFALQCSPDHPWVTQHPEWFNHRPDGSIKHAENPPKKYQDIYPLNFWPPHDEDRRRLWEACKQILDYWIAKGVKIFRVDNPHTKPISFWAWLIREIQARHPDVIFLSEAFTRPKVMSKLAEVGFTQSYTYFAWRNSKKELTTYLTELAGPRSDYLRPNFWTNTPDILSGPLRFGGPAAFKMRLVLAATMSPSYGMYSGYELLENVPASEENEEYQDSEKYEIKRRNHSSESSIADFVARVNRIRRRHAAFRDVTNVRFHHAEHHNVLVYSKSSDDLRDVMLMVVNLDPNEPVESALWLNLELLGLPWDRSYVAYDELDGAKYVWESSQPNVRLDPAERVAHIMHMRRR
ncbi:MAG TPA: alpha-1,4-glucan--maltose-1-phosphate maltosyltransferase [Actinomycetota bacterium]|nr:alpha-1,4-glucan--maltose-1-phosphate maltosyltransferase [Actinomycetota bacterium]